MVRTRVPFRRQQQLTRSRAWLGRQATPLGGAASCILLLLALRPEWSGWWALLALTPLLITIRADSRLPALVPAAAAASFGVSLPAYEGVLPSFAWAFPLLALLHVPQVLLPALAQRHALRSGNSLAALLAFPLVWTALEFTSSRYGLWGSFTAFHSLAYSQFDTPLLPVVRWSGVSLLSFLLVLSSSALARALTAGTLSPVLLSSASLLLLSLPLPGESQPATHGDALRVGVVQPVFSHTQYQAAERHPAAANVLLHTLAAQSLELAVDLLVWPETVLAGVASAQASPALLKLAGDRALLFGQVTEESNRLFNSALLLEDGQLFSAYDKLALVPMLETGLLSPGNRISVLEAAGFSWAPLICLDSVFETFSRQAALAGAKFLVVLSNSEFAEYLATPELHLRVSAFRAAELGVPLVFAASSGPSALIDASGRVVTSLPESTQATLDFSVPPAAPATFFRLHGNWFGWLTLAALPLLLFRNQTFTSGCASFSRQLQRKRAPDG